MASVTVARHVTGCIVRLRFCLVELRGIHFDRWRSRIRAAAIQQFSAGPRFYLGIIIVTEGNLDPELRDSVYESHRGTVNLPRCSGKDELGVCVAPESLKLVGSGWPAYASAAAWSRLALHDIRRQRKIPGKRDTFAGPAG